MPRLLHATARQKPSSCMPYIKKHARIRCAVRQDQHAQFKAGRRCSRTRALACMVRCTKAAERRCMQRPEQYSCPTHHACTCTHMQQLMHAWPYGRWPPAHHPPSNQCASKNAVSCAQARGTGAGKGREGGGKHMSTSMHPMACAWGLHDANRCLHVHACEGHAIGTGYQCHTLAINGTGYHWHYWLMARTGWHWLIAHGSAMWQSGTGKLGNGQVLRKPRMNTTCCTSSQRTRRGTCCLSAGNACCMHARALLNTRLQPTPASHGGADAAACMLPPHPPELLHPLHAHMLHACLTCYNVTATAV